MSPMDIITVATLSVGTIPMIGLYVLYRRNKIPPPETWPRFAGLGAFGFAFLSLMAPSLLLRPFSEIVEYAPTNTFLALLFGLAGYVTVAAHVRHNRKK